MAVTVAGLWDRWVAHCHRPTDPRIYAVIRILCATLIAIDLLRAAQLGLLPWILNDWDHGGIPMTVNASYVMDDLFGTWGGPLAFAGALIAFVLAALGIAPRASLLVGIVCFAQLGHLHPPGDRGIDRILRTSLLFVVMSGTHRAYTVTGPARATAVPAWPADLIRWLLVMVYMAAGFGKLSPHLGTWFGLHDHDVVYRIMTYPMQAYLDPVAMEPLMPAFRLLSWGTVAMEIAGFLIVTRWAKWWGLIGIALHLGLAATVDLGIFPFGMLALYPVIYEAETLRFLDWLEARIPRRAAPAG